VEVEPLVFKTVDGWKTVIFRADEQGKITHLFLDNENAFERVAWYEAPYFSRAMLAIGLIGLSSALATGVAGIVLRRHPGSHHGRGPRLARQWAIAASGAALLLVAALLRFIQTGGLNYGATLEAWLLLGLAWLAALLLVGVPILAVVGWHRSYWGKAWRLHYTLVALAAVEFVWVLAHWNLLSVSL
jgi:hypothetical protein